MSTPTRDSFACALPPAELRQRRGAVLERVRRQALRIEAHETGFLFHFQPCSLLEEELARFVDFEATCCAFIQMVVKTSATENTLSMSAAPEVKPIMRAEFVDV